jgi:arylsulfatase A-like enzyme
MIKNSFVISVGSLVIASVMPHISASAKNKQPNIVFIFSDQQSADMLGCYGNKQIKTPVIDQLAKEGVLFEKCYASQPVSSPMRGMLLTGQHPLYNAVFSNDISVNVEEGTSFGEVLKNKGYATAYIGKWHLLGGDRNRPIPKGKDRLGFDVFLSNNCTLDFSPEHAFYFNEAGEKVKFNKWEAYGQTDQAVEFIKNADKKKPFALFVSYHPPHDQGAARYGNRRYNTIPELMNLYSRDSIALRPTALELAGVNGTNIEELRTDYHGYYAMCSGIDKAVGEIVETLRKKGTLDNTIIVYTSDHGDNLHSHARPWTKSSPENAAANVPLIIRYPKKVKANKVSDMLVGTLDLMPTILGLADVKAPAVCQGLDLSPIIIENKDVKPTSIPIFYFRPNWRGVVTQRYIFSFDPFEEKNDQTFNVLFDKNIDPLQQHNLFYEPAYREVRDELFQLTLEWMRKFNDPMISDADIMKVCGFTNSKLSLDQTDGRINGRPVDLIANSNRKSLIPLRMPTPEEELILLERVKAREMERINNIIEEKKAVILKQNQ